MTTSDRATTPNTRPAVILGAGGFIGINLARHLVASGVQTTCVARTANPAWPASVGTVLTDLTDPNDALIDAMAGAVVYHLFSSTRPARSTDGAVREIAENLEPTIGLLERTRGRDCRWVFTSSGGTVYGEPRSVPLDETHPTNPISSYGAMKLATETYFGLYRHLHGTDSVIARVSNPYGPFHNPDRGQGLIGVLMDRIMNDAPIDVWGDGSAVRDFIHVQDVVEALSVLGGHTTSGEIYNIGSGEGHSVNQLIDEIAELLDRRPTVRYKAARGVDVSVNILAIDKIEAATGWKPALTLAQGLRLLIRNTGERPDGGL